MMNGVLHESFCQEIGVGFILQNVRLYDIMDELELVLKTITAYVVITYYQRKRTNFNCLNNLAPLLSSAIWYKGSLKQTYMYKQLSKVYLPVWKRSVPDSFSAPRSRDQWPRLAPPSFSPTPQTPRTTSHFSLLRP